MNYYQIYTRLIDGVKYLKIHDDNSLKFGSLEDNIYFTLRDIFLNTNNCDLCMDANTFNEKLTNNIFYEDRNKDYHYADVVNDKVFLSQLMSFLNKIQLKEFEFETPPDYIDDESKSFYYDIDFTQYIKLDEWMIQLNDLKSDIYSRINSLD
jgi:hypothetical protein